MGNKDVADTNCDEHPRSPRTDLADAILAKKTSVSPQMEPFIYRFRSVHALLNGFQELEKQEIYFASPPELNDPLEGYKDLFWQGDVIIWRNFLRHYLLCLMHTVLLALEHGSNDVLATKALPVALTTEELQPEIRKIFEILCERFFEDTELSALPTLLAERKSPVRRNELLSVLWPIHSRLLNLVFTTLSPDSPVHPFDESLRAQPNRALRLKESFAALNKMDESRPDSMAITEQMSTKVVSIVMQTIFALEYSGVSKPAGALWNTIKASFPDLYLNSLEQLLYYDWYTSCFVADPLHAAMWGNYGDSHKGVCLKFKTSSLSPNKPALMLRQIVGTTGKSGGTPVYDFRPLELHRVQYQNRYAEIDFFRSLGTLTPSQLNFWFVDKSGTISSTGLNLLQRSTEWRQAYWQGFQNAVTTKLIDWKHEQEYRLTLHSTITNLSDRASRKLRYDFNDLQGIIFGIKTKPEDKLAIVNIVQQKCIQAGRKDFEFHQTYYSRLTGKIATDRWDAIKFS